MIPDELADTIVREVAELPDRTSPTDWPEAMLVTGDELRSIVRAAFVAAQAQATTKEVCSYPQCECRWNDEHHDPTACPRTHALRPPAARITLQEPTDAMIAAGIAAALAYVARAKDDQTLVEARGPIVSAVYKAMVAAAEKTK